MGLAPIYPTDILSPHSSFYCLVSPTPKKLVLVLKLHCVFCVSNLFSMASLWSSCLVYAYVFVCLDRLLFYRFVCCCVVLWVPFLPSFFLSFLLLGSFAPSLLVAMCLPVVEKMGYLV